MPRDQAQIAQPQRTDHWVGTQRPELYPYGRVELQVPVGRSRVSVRSTRRRRPSIFTRALARVTTLSPYRVTVQAPPVVAMARSVPPSSDCAADQAD